MPVVRCTPLVSRVIATNANAAGSAEPYVVTRLSWFAASSRCGGTRLGTVASFAGPHTRLIASISTVAANTQ